jgi:hypothetical protein
LNEKPNEGPVYIYVHSLVDFDLTASFSEGFIGYSIELSLTGKIQESEILDVSGNQVIWSTLQKFEYSFTDKPLKVTLYEHRFGKQHVAE